jgi:transposase
MWTPEARRRYSWTRRKEGLRLTDEEWAVIEPLLPEHDRMGCPWKHELRTIVDAIVHLLRTGCAWSALPDWAPPRSTVYEWFRRLTDGGWLETIHHALLLAVRELQGREASPTLAIIDSQTVKVMAPAGPRGGACPQAGQRPDLGDNAKKINGRKRHILADSRGHLLAVLVTEGALQSLPSRTRGIATAASIWCATSRRSSPGSSSSSPTAPTPGGSKPPCSAATSPSRSCAARSSPRGSSYCPRDGVSNRPSVSHGSADACSSIMKHCLMSRKVGSAWRPSGGLFAP